MKRVLGNCGLSPIVETYFDIWQRAMEEDADRRPILRVLRDDRGKITEWCQYRFNENRDSHKN